MYTIIEDCSPYYIRFTHPGLDEVINKCAEFVKGIDFTNWEFAHHRHPEEESQALLALVPMTAQINIQQERVSTFVTQPGKYYRAHKDGMANHISINYTVKIRDRACVTSWYSDSDLKDYPIDNLANNSRECTGFDRKKHTPLKSMIAQQGECILFNTEIFHDFDNSQAKHERMVLTLRLVNPEEYYFDDIKKILFGI